MDSTTTSRRQAQKGTPPPRSRTTRCEDCGERVEVEPGGFRTLCACDAAA